MITLKKDIKTFSFYEREKVGGMYVRNKCGRDFLYYALHYYFPQKFNSEHGNPVEIDKKRLFGISVPSWLAWTQIQFVYVARFFRVKKLVLQINERVITSFFGFVSAILFSRISYERAVNVVEESVRADKVCAIDVSLGWWGLLDHVLFVYGFDEDYLYVVDTHCVANLPYEKMEYGDYYFRLPKQVIRDRWTHFGRVWQVY